MYYTNSKGYYILMGLLVLLFSNCRKEESPFGKYKNQQKVNSNYEETLIVYFKDKNTNEYHLDKPEQYLSQRAIARRKNQQINVDSTDLPVSSHYISELVTSTKGKILQTSKWLNYVVIQLPEDFQDYKAIEQLNFVSKTKKIGVHIAFEEPIFSISNNPNEVKPISNSQQIESLLTNEEQYGNTLRLLNQYQARVLHQNNYFGKDKAIAILADGFGYINEKPELAHLISEQKIIDQYDFIYNKKDLSTTSTSGNNQLGLLAAINPGNYIGLAPKSTFALYRIDLSGSQEPYYEACWVAAAERADSIGIDIISSSSVYGLKFNEPKYNISENQANGTSISSKAADMAWNKGIITVQMFPLSNSDMDFILPPADAKHIIAVGNLNKRSEAHYAVMDRPTFDGRMKPEFAVLTNEIPVIYGWGDSYNTAHTPPIFAGLVACLWEAFPKKSAKEIRNMLEKSASQYQNPDNKLGFGIPNFKKAFEQNK